MSSYNARRQGVRDGREGKEPFQHKSDFNQSMYMEGYAKGQKEREERISEPTPLDIATLQGIVELIEKENESLRNSCIQNQIEKEKSKANEEEMFSALQSKIAIITELESEAKENCRIVGMSGEKELSLLEKCGDNERIISKLTEQRDKLLEALILLEKEMVESGNAGSVDYGWKPAIEKTRAAIAKATSK